MNAEPISFFTVSSTRRIVKMRIPSSNSIVISFGGPRRVEAAPSAKLPHSLVISASICDSTQSRNSAGTRVPGEPLASVASVLLRA
jgi:hypothetical protein